jgi:cyclopropane fatty-acyl-phospholipid synthase-like methyltransferase
VEPDMVRFVDELAVRERLPNLQGVLGTTDDARVPAPVERILMVNTYHHVSERPAYFARLRGSLAPGGWLVIIDFTREAPMGPPPEMRLPAEQVTRELGEAGYRLVASHDFLPHQYFLVYAAAQ